MSVSAPSDIPDKTSPYRSALGLAVAIEKLDLFPATPAAAGYPVVVAALHELAEEADAGYADLDVILRRCEVTGHLRRSPTGKTLSIGIRKSGCRHIPMYAWILDSQEDDQFWCRVLNCTILEVAKALGIRGEASELDPHVEIAPGESGVITRTTGQLLPISEITIPHTCWD